MFGLPVGLLIRIGIALAVTAALAWAAHLAMEHFRAQGRTEVQVKWDADKAARIKRTTEITLTLIGKLTEAQDAAATLQRKLDAMFAPLTERAGSVAYRGGIAVGADVARLLDDASRAANSTRPDAGTKAGPDPVPDTPAPQGLVAYDEREFADFAVKAAAAYADAVLLWRACRAREDGYLDAMLKGAMP